MFRRRSGAKAPKRDRMVNVIVRTEDWDRFIRQNPVGKYFVSADTEEVRLFIPVSVAKRLRTTS